MQQRTAHLYPRAPIYFALLLLVAVVGFYPSFFSRLKDADLAHHFHGIAATAWMLLLIAQGWLMRQRNVSSHRMFGRISFVLAPLFVASGFVMIHTMLGNADPFSQTFGPRLAFVDLTTIVYFAIAYGLAIRHRRNVQLHARYLASTAILVLPPALARTSFLIPGIESFEAAFHVSYFASELIVAILLLDDARQGGVRKPYLVLLALLLVQQAGFLSLAGAGWWNSLCAWVGAL